MHTTRVSFIERLGNKEEGAWKQLEQVYNPMIRNWLRRFNVQSHDVDDLTQEVMLVLSRQIGQFEHSGNVGAFRNWLRTTTVNLTHNFLRKHKKGSGGFGSSEVRDMVTQLADPESRISREFDLEHDRFVVRRLLERISGSFEPVTLEIFDRHVLQGAGAKETAEHFGVSVASVHTAKSRVLRQLRANVVDLFDDLLLSR